MSSATAQATLSLHATPFNAALSAASARLDAFGNKLSSAIGSSVVGQLAAVTAGVMGVTSALNAMSGTLSQGVRLNSSLEQTKLALATLLGQFEGDRFGDFNSRIREASSILEILREKGRVAEATFADLANTLQLTAGSFFAEGIKGAEQQADMIVAVSQALAAYGGDQSRLTSEITNLLRGQVNQWDRVAKGAGITAEELKKAKAEGQLFQYIMGKLGPVIADAEQGLGTFASLVTANREEIDNLTTSLAAPMFDVLKEGLEEVLSALKGDEFKNSISDISYQLGLLMRAGVDMSVALVKALPALTQMAATIASVLVPALAVLTARKVTAGIASSAMAAKMQTSLAAMRASWMQTVPRLSYTLKELQYNMLFATGMTGKMSAAFTIMGMNISRAMTAMAASVKAAFIGMVRSGQLAAIGIQAALAAATAGFMMAMNYVAKVNQRIDETNDIGDAMVGDAQKGMADRGYKMNKGGQFERTATGVSTETEQATAVEEFAAEREKLEKERQKFAAEAYKPTSVIRQAGDMTPDKYGNIGYTIEQDYSQEDQMKLDAMDARIAGLKAQENAISNLTSAQLAENAALKERKRLEDERQQYLAELPKKITDASKSLADAEKQSAWDAMTPDQQKDKLLSDVGATNAADVDAQLNDLNAKNESGAITDEQREKLLMLITTKEKLLAVEKEIAAEAERSAKREKELAARREQVATRHAEDLAIAQATAAGDNERAQALQDEQRKRQTQQELTQMGFDPAQAESMAQQGMEAEQAIREARKTAARQRNEQDIAAAVARATGDDKQAEAIEKQQRYDDIVKQQQEMGYSEQDAKQNARTLMASEEAQVLESQLDANAAKASPLAASSLMSVGGGGISVGGGIDPMVEENRRHTRLLEIIAENTRNQRSPANKAQPSTWENN